MVEPTDVQLETMEFIRAHYDAYELAPTFLEIAEHFDVSTNAIWCRIKLLEKKCFVATREGKARSIRLTKRGREVFETARRVGV